jgi:hypothetical protein
VGVEEIEVYDVRYVGFMWLKIRARARQFVRVEVCEIS